MASKSTRARFYRLTGLTLGGIVADDNSSLQFSSSSTPMGSGSETDRYANHFLQGTQIAKGATIRIKDLCAANIYRSMMGSITSWKCYVPKASMGDTTTGFFFTSNTTGGGGALIKTVKIDGAFNKEGEAEITLIFRSTGTASGVSMTSLRTPS